MEPTGAALVTGASRGIGRAVACELVARGFDVTASMRDPAAGADLPATGPGRLHVARLDVNDPAGIEIPPGLRVLVNNAGVEAENLPIETAGLDLWRTLFETNVFGLVNVTRAAIPVLRANGGGVIVNVTSSSLLVPVPFLGLYRASKAAVSALGESLQAEVAGFGIRVLEVMPGPIQTDMLASGDHPAEAIEVDEYRTLAEALWTARQGIRDQHTPATEAARRIVDALLDDDGPLRVGCDPLSEGLLGARDAVAGHDAWFRPLLAAFGASA
jgi:NAD(P)-dependent dehydrogenase (short-subunit alcohol dehydrogenase family)